jgi:hypothetical protein
MRQEIWKSRARRLLLFGHGLPSWSRSPGLLTVGPGSGDGPNSAWGAMATEVVAAWVDMRWRLAYSDCNRDRLVANNRSGMSAKKKRSESANKKRSEEAKKRRGKRSEEEKRREERNLNRGCGQTASRKPSAVPAPACVLGRVWAAGGLPDSPGLRGAAVSWHRCPALDAGCSPHGRC